MGEYKKYIIMAAVAIVAIAVVFRTSLRQYVVGQ